MASRPGQIRTPGDITVSKSKSEIATVRPLVSASNTTPVLFAARLPVFGAPVESTSLRRSSTRGFRTSRPGSGRVGNDLANFRTGSSDWRECRSVP